MDAAGVKLCVGLIILGVVVKQAASSYSTCDEIRKCQLDFSREADVNMKSKMCSAYKMYFVCVQEARPVCKSSGDPKFLLRLRASTVKCRSQCPAAEKDTGVCSVHMDGPQVGKPNEGDSSAIVTGSVGINPGGLTVSGQGGDNSKGNTANGITRGEVSKEEDDIEEEENATGEEVVDKEELYEGEEVGDEDDIKEEGGNTDIMSTSNSTEVPSPEPEGKNKGVTSLSTSLLLMGVIFFQISLL